jgi:hypothetical protein
MKRELPVVTYLACASHSAPLDLFGLLIGVARLACLTDLAASQNSAGLRHPPNLSRASRLTASTCATLRFPRHWLQHRCAPATFRGSVGIPPLLTGTSSSSSKLNGSPALRMGSMGSPHIQQGMPMAFTLAESARLLAPFA